MLQQIDVVSADGVRDLVFVEDGRVLGCGSGKFCGPSGDGWSIGGVLYTTIEVEAEILITMEDTREMLEEALKAISTDAGVTPVSTDPIGDSVSPQLEVAKEVMAEDAEALKALGEIAPSVQPETSEIPEGTTAADLGVNAEPDDANEPEE